MKRRKLGTTGFEVAPLAFGGNVFGWTADEPTSFRLLDTFVDAGFNLIEAADMDAAVRIAESMPWTRYGAIEVRPVRDIDAVRRRVGA